jgi:protein-tyrosine-phosphatase
MSGPHILVVCTANICRSPVAEAVLRDKLQKADRSDWMVSSAGTWAEAGHAASSMSVTLMAERELDIQAHGSRAVTGQLMAQSDLVLCMETRHLEWLQQAFPEQKHKVYTIRQMVGQRGSVRDPYGGSRRQYERMVAEVADLLEAGFAQIQTVAWANYQKRGKDGTS